ncbi:hypothetical protein HU200_065724 [Digitaria exilis]|uniref:Uncharacterized protein n=1 Tax=Digitaria exilis TaxID=1010633 RepID=A0A835DXK2_9POAL|nr:hypothetical protein HU200_065724 [Digitaria exilis]
MRPQSLALRPPRLFALPATNQAVWSPRPGGARLPRRASSSSTRVPIERQIRGIIELSSSERSDSYLDVVLIPLAVLFPALYHLWLYHTVRRTPAAARRLWVFSMMRYATDFYVSQTLKPWRRRVQQCASVRNVLMGSTLVPRRRSSSARAVAAVLSSTYAVKKPLSDAVFGAHGEYMMALKYVVILLVFLLAFLCHSLAICTLNQASFLVNGALTRGFMLNLAGNRLFFAGAPLLLWIFGPVLPCLCSMAMLPILYNIDMIEYAKKGSSNGEAKVEMDTESDQSTEV